MTLKLRALGLALGAALILAPVAGFAQSDALDRSVVILFRIPQRPDCVFGSRNRIWPPSRSDSDVPTPKDDAERVVTHGVDEYVEQGGLVVHPCVPGGVTWLP